MREWCEILCMLQYLRTIITRLLMETNSAIHYDFVYSSTYSKVKYRTS